MFTAVHYRARPLVGLKSSQSDALQLLQCAHRHQIMSHRLKRELGSLTFKCLTSHKLRPEFYEGGVHASMFMTTLPVCDVIASCAK